MLSALTAASLLVLRRRGISEQPRPLILPGRAAIAVAATLLCIWLMLQADRSAWVSALGCLGVGAAVFLAARMRGREELGGP